MSNEQLDQAEQHHVQETDGADSLGSTLFTVGLFVVMVVFVIGCWQLGWFQ